MFALGTHGIPTDFPKPGLVGGCIVLQLLQRGQSPESIRVLDFCPPTRPDLTQGPAAAVDFVRADISDASSVRAGFAKPWPSAAVAGLPLTVFHVAAALRVADRALAFWERSSRVNVDGTANLLAAAREAGADVFVATSSAGVAVRPVPFLSLSQALGCGCGRGRGRGRGGRGGRGGMVQFCDEQDFEHPVRPHDEFFGNYAHTKALAERLVCGADAPGFRTGCLRPGNGIYGLPSDMCLGKMMTWESHVSINGSSIQNFVSAWNVSLAHLDYEAALLQQPSSSSPSPTGTGTGTGPKCSGRPFVITDNGPPPQWADTCRAIQLLRGAGADGVNTNAPEWRVTTVPTLPVYLWSFVLEWYRLALARCPALTRWPLSLREPGGSMAMLGPGVFTNIHACVICVDDAARRSVGEGGIGYRGGATTLEGVCEMVRRWNEEWSRTWGKEVPPPVAGGAAAGEKKGAVVVPRVAA